MTQAPGLITSECVRTTGSANPETTIMEVMNRPRSTGPALASYDENSSPPQCANSALGRGANTNVSAAGKYMGHEPLDSRLLDSPTKRGSQFVQSAHERMISKNPRARTKDKRMTASFVH